MKKVIEFNGIPGSGKTTYINYLKENLPTQFKIYFLEDIYFYRETNRIMGKLKILRLLFSKRFFEILIGSISGIENFKLSFESTSDILRYIKLESNLILFFENEEFDLIILEEGLIQYFLSIPYQNRIMNNRKFLEQFLFPNKALINSLNIVNLDISVSDSISRISQRSHLSNEFKLRRIDALTEEKKEKVLKINIENLLKIRSIFSTFITIDSSQDVKYNINLIESFIYGKVAETND